jgi:hypothetical protein
MPIQLKSRSGSTYITEQQYSIVKQPYRELYCKVNLLNYQFQVVDDISGVVLSDTWTISATSDIRRTGTLVILPDNDEAYKIQAGSKIFLDKYVQVYIGIKDEITDEIVYNNMGIYLINNPTHTFDSTNNSITLQLVDLMAKLTGLRNGNLAGYEYQLKEGQDVKEIIVAVLAEVGFNNYNIEIDEGDYQTIQFDMSVDGTATLYDILKTINENQYINYQMYFDVDGIFHFNHIPSGKDAPVMVDDDIWQYAYISHEVTTNYEDLKNDIVVLGKTHTASKYSNDCVLNNHTFTMSSASVKREKNHIKLAFTTPENMTPTVDGEQYYLNLNNYGSYPLRTTLGSLHFRMLPNTYYVVRLQNFGRESLSLIGAQNTTTYTLKKALPLDDMGVTASDIVGWYVSALAKSLNEAITENAKIVSYNEQNLTITLSKSINTDKAWTGRLCYMYNPNTTSTYWQFMGENQPRAEIKDENPSSPFYVNGSVGDIRIVLSGGDYDNISTNELAMERAQYELYTRCRLNDNMSLTVLPIYWLDVNWLIEITLPTEHTPKRFLTKEITISSGVTGVQNITLMSFYNFYEDGGH